MRLWLVNDAQIALKSGCLRIWCVIYSNPLKHGGPEYRKHHKHNIRTMKILKYQWLRRPENLENRCFHSL